MTSVVGGGLQTVKLSQTPPEDISRFVCYAMPPMTGGDGSD